MIYSATLHKEMISYDLKVILMASEFMKLLGCIKTSKNLTAISNLPFSILVFRPGAILLFF